MPPQRGNPQRTQNRRNNPRDERIYHPEEVLERYQQAALAAFGPRCNVHLAISRYAKENKVEDIFFFDHNKKRCVYRKDLDYSKNGYHIQRYVKNYNDNRTYLLPHHVRTLKEIDHPKPKWMQVAVRHPSEGDWKRWGKIEMQNDDDRKTAKNLLNLPTEIVMLIIKYSLVIDESKVIVPYTVACNLATEFCPPHFDIEKDPKDFTYGGFRKIYQQHLVDSASTLYDNRGPYTQLRRYFRAHIDAAMLRTCKLFYKLGQEMLLGGNKIFFRTINYHRYSSPPSLLSGNQVYRPAPEKNLRSFDIEEGLEALRAADDVRKIPGWVYFDRFLRFLFHIGVKNASLIKSLHFEGDCLVHDCIWQTCGMRQGQNRCDEDLIVALSCYIPFIRRYCTGLESLTIYARKDVYYEHYPQCLPAQDQPRRPTHEETLRPLLEGENGFRSIESLQKLEIFGSKLDRSDVLFAKETKEWFEERTKQRSRVKRGKLL